MIAARRARPSLPLISWGLCALLPMAAYALPLWRNALADTPIAYLIWIPFLAVAWAMWNLATIALPYPTDRELDVLLGGGITALVGAVLALAPARWAASMVFAQGGLLLWPLWALGLAWLLFGIGVTRRLVGPLAYWLLAWPPIFTAIADRTQGLLVTWAIRALDVMAGLVSWVRPGQTAGTFWVDHGGHWAGVVVAQACSGADSLLGAAILLPLMLTVWKGPRSRMGVLAALALAGALILNWVRLFVLVAAVHVIGPSWTFGVLHPMLGFLLFALLGGLLAVLAGPLGLAPVPRPALPRLRLPGSRRLALAGGFSLALFGALWPLFRLPPGNAGNPQPVATTQLSTILPAVAGFHRTLVYRANESSILGPHSHTLAYLYQAPGGASALAEVWSAADVGTLAAYGFRNCLLYHGDHILAVRSFVLPSGLPATAYAVAMAPSQVGQPRAVYVDVEWTSAVKTPAGVRYLRWSVASFPSPPSGWPSAVRLASVGGPVSGLAAVATPPSHGNWPAALAATQHRLRQFAGVLATGGRLPGRTRQA